MSKKLLSVIICTDMMASFDQTWEEELASMEADLRTNLPMFDFTVKTNLYPHKLLEGEKCDIYVFDFGGMMPGCESMVVNHFRSLCKAIEDKPNTLFVIWSSFSYDVYYKDMLETEFPQLANVPNVVAGWEHDAYIKIEEFFS
jgi:hypothetical protein